MATDILALKKDGVKFYPQSHASAIENLDKVIDDKLVDAGAGAVSSVNGKTGVVTLTAADVNALPNTTQIPTVPGIATTSANGLMSSSDKTKLNGIATGAEKNPSAATASTAGLMSAADKTKLDGLPSITFEKVGTV